MVPQDPSWAEPRRYLCKGNHNYGLPGLARLKLEKKVSPKYSLEASLDLELT